jgi:hypothetical protein
MRLGMLLDSGSRALPGEAELVRRSPPSHRAETSATLTAVGQLRTLMVGAEPEQKSPIQLEE